MLLKEEAAEKIKNIFLNEIIDFKLIKQIKNKNGKNKSRINKIYDTREFYS